MSNTQISLAVLAILALVIVAFFAVFRGKGKFKIKTKLGEASAEGENPPPPGKVAGGVNMKGIHTGGKATALSRSEGGANLEDITAVGDVSAIHEPGAPPKT